MVDKLFPGHFSGRSQGLMTVQAYRKAFDVPSIYLSTTILRPETPNVFQSQRRRRHYSSCLLHRVITNPLLSRPVQNARTASGHGHSLGNVGRVGEQKGVLSPCTHYLSKVPVGIPDCRCKVPTHPCRHPVRWVCKDDGAAQV